jgi:hypothetical protein
MLRLEIKKPFIQKIIGIMKEQGVSELNYHLSIKLMNLRVSVSENLKVKDTKIKFLYVDEEDNKAYLVKKV